ncbi:MAG: GAF domain-containing protein [Chloroflexi bacterium]|nr:GAF domain-containing protein [Chloroflexota bacterium]
MLPDFRIHQRDYLLEITRALTQELELDKLLARILRFAVEMLAGQAGLIALRDEQRGWAVAAAHGIPTAFLRHVETLLEDVPLQEDAARHELPEVYRRLEAVTRAASLGLLTGVGLPLIFHDQVIGVIFIFRSYASVFSADDRLLLQSFADQAAIAVRNARLYEQVRQEKRRLDALLDAVADGMLILTANHTIERCNPAFAHLYGLPCSEILGRQHEEIIRWAKVEQGMPLEVAEADGWPLTPRATLYVQGDLIRPNQQPLPVGITYAPLLSTDGALLNIIATVRDITHFREAEELKSTFISIISHELKTPIALIKGYVSTLRREDAHWDAQIVQESLAVIEEEADRLAQLVEGLLEASRLQAGAVELHFSDVSLRHLAERLVHRMAVSDPDHKYELHLPDDLPIVPGDEQRLEQVLSNLLSNAAKYSPPGTTIRVEGFTRPDRVVLCVQDEGPGIAPEDAPHIFDRFYRSRDAVRHTKGAGLGLYLARAIVEAHNGRIWVDPTDRGARVCFSLPVPPSLPTSSS